jgi:TP901 family phage tail tape measure protein
MAEDSTSGSTHVEKVLLDIEAPAQKLQSSESGLNVSIRKLGAIDRLLSSIDRKWSSLASKMSATPLISRGQITPRPAGGATAGSASSIGGGATASITVRTSKGGDVVTEFEKVLDRFGAHVRKERVDKDGPAGSVDRESFARSTKAQVQDDIARAQAAFSQSLVGQSQGKHEDMLREAAAHKKIGDEIMHATKAREADLVASGQQVFVSQQFAKAEGHYRRASDLANQVAESQNRLANSTRLIGKNMIDNIAHVTAWAASVAVLYKGLELVGSAVQSTIAIQAQSARLGQVMSDPAQVNRMTREVLALAAAEKRTATEAMESAIDWSRMQLTRVEANEAVRVSLVAANVADISAAEATEHLIALKTTYGLRIAQLAPLLGQLNSISNTYNVTVNQMLQGLSKTAAIAAQAGISLQELQGIVGAVVGATKQSGANIGNSIKSIIGSLSTKDTQQMLREGFHFETTTRGGEEMKEMSQILAEMFIAYQKMGSAERQTMIYSIAGKNQASRMAALLDNYVKAQILAINATENLSSADRENEAITNTLRASITGLISEFQRFAYIQGTSGPAQALKEVANALQNVLKIANTGGISQGVSTFGVLFTAMAAKMALTGFQMQKLTANKVALNGALSKNPSIVSNTFAALARSIADMRNVMNSALTTLPPFFQRMAGLTAVMGPQNVAAVSAFRGALVIGMATLWEFLVPIIVITGAVMAFNRVFDEFSGINKTSSDAVGKFAQDAERAASAAQSAALAARLFKTTGDALGNIKSPAGKLALLQQVSEAAFPIESGMTNEQRAARENNIEALRKEFALKLRANDVTGIATRLEELRSQAIVRGAAKRQEEFEAIKRQEAEYNSRIQEIKNGVFAGGISEDSKKRSIEEVEAKLASLQEKRNQMRADDADNNAKSYQEFLAGDQQHLTYLERQKAVLSEISSLMSDMPHAGQVDALNIEISKLEAVRDYHQKIFDLLQARKQAAESAGQNTSTTEELQAQIDARRTAISQKQALIKAGEAQSSVEFGGEGQYQTVTTPATMPESEKLRLLQEIKTEEVAITELEKKMADEAKTGSNLRLKGAIDEARKRRDEASAELEGKKAQEVRDLAELRDRRAVISRIAGAYADSYGVGDGPGEQFVNRRKKIQEELAALEARRLSPAGLGNDSEQTRDNLRNAALELRVRLNEMLISGEEKLLELGKEEQNLLISKRREFERSLLSAGPGQLLRQLALSQLTQNGTNSGRFFALSPEARQDFLNRPEQDQQVRQLRRDQAALRRAGFGRRSVDQIQNEFIAGQNESRGSIASNGVSEINAAAVAAALSLSTMNRNATAVASTLTDVNTSLGNLRARVDALFPGGPVDAQAQAVHFRGHGAGSSF